MEIKLEKFAWKQIGGDINPGSYGGTIAQSDGATIEVRVIQPTREYIGDKEAPDVGFPFWSTVGCYDLADLDVDRNEVVSAMGFVGLTAETLLDLHPAERAIAIAEALADYGDGISEGPCGWAKDIVPGRVQWCASDRPAGWRFLSDEDREFRQLLKGK
jgi:hypothetical protein